VRFEDEYLDTLVDASWPQCFMVQYTVDFRDMVVDGLPI
jgi:hypothetical protein